MKFRMATAAIFGTLGLAFAVPSAQAAVTVLGHGQAANCYKIAEFGGNPKSGVETCSSALQNETLSLKDRAATLINRGILKSRCDDLHGALADYQSGLKLNDKMGEAYVDRGATLISMHRYHDALDDITHGLELGAKHPAIAYYDRAIVREALGNVRGAYEDLKKSLALDPNFGQASMQIQRFHVVRSGGLGGA